MAKPTPCALIGSQAWICRDAPFASPSETVAGMGLQMHQHATGQSDHSAKDEHRQSDGIGFDPKAAGGLWLVRLHFLNATAIVH